MINDAETSVKKVNLLLQLSDTFSKLTEALDTESRYL